MAKLACRFDKAMYLVSFKINGMQNAEVDPHKVLGKTQANLGN